MDTGTFKILEYSACGNKKSAQKLKFSGDHDLRIIYAIKQMVNKTNWDIISVRDISNHALKKLEPELLFLGYRMFIDPTWKTVKDKWRYTCLSMLFAKDSVGFAQIAGNEGFETVLRYICGKFTFNGNEIFYRTSHIPCVDDTRSQLAKQIERKERMLEAEISFQKEHQQNYAICSGDYNGALDEDCYCKELFDEFLFVDTITEPTYESKKLDHVYVSDGLSNSTLSVESEILDDFYMQFSDHKMISITLKAS